jgi:hypothetical protein
MRDAGASSFSILLGLGLCAALPCYGTSSNNPAVGVKRYHSHGEGIPTWSETETCYQIQN